MVRVLLLIFLGIIMVQMSDGSECSRVFVNTMEAVRVPWKDLAVKQKETCQAFFDLKSCLNQGPAYDRQVMQTDAFKSLDESCTLYRCASNCQNIIKHVTSSTSIEDTCIAYGNFKSCLLGCPGVKSVSLGGNGQLIEYVCNDGNRRRYRRDVSSRFYDAVSEVGSRLPDPQMNIFDDVNQMRALLK